MDKLQIYIMGMANTSATPFTNLADTLFIPAAFLMLYVFERFEMEFVRIVWNVSLFWFKSYIFLSCFSTDSMVNFLTAARNLH